MKLRKFLSIATCTVKVIDLDNKDNEFTQYWNDQNRANYFRDEDSYSKYKRIADYVVNEVSSDKKGTIVVFVKKKSSKKLFAERDFLSSFKTVVKPYWIV